MKTIKIYGASDDLVEIEGDFREEFSSCSAMYLHFSNGAIVKAEFSDDGCWELTVVDSEGFEIVSHDKPPKDCDDNYSHELTLRGDFDWVECWKSQYPGYDELNEAITGAVDSDLHHELNPDEKLEIYRRLVGHYAAKESA